VGLGGNVLLNNSLHFLSAVFVGDGFSTCFVSSSRGLRQGDPSLLLLFVLMMEALGRMISATMNAGLLSSFSVGTWVDISHLLFAYDTFLFCGANPNHLRILRSMFLLFEAMLGLKTNLSK
jgi:hypothetical protein